MKGLPSDSRITVSSAFSGKGPAMDSARRRALTVRANRLKPAMVVGRAGVSEGVVAQADGLLSRSDLIKVRVDVVGGAEADALATALADAAGAQLVRRIGRVAILHRPEPDEPTDETVEPKP